MTTHKVLTGMGIVGTLFNSATDNETRAQIIASTLVGTNDDLILCALYAKHRGCVPETVEMAEADPLAQMGLSRLKNMIRDAMQTAIEAEDNKARQSLLAQLKRTNEPHKMGTIKEIATKLGVSLSEVRRMKASGALDAMESL